MLLLLIFISLFFYFFFGLEDILTNKIDSVIISEAFIMIFSITLFTWISGKNNWNFAFFINKFIILLLFLLLFKKRKVGGADVKILFVTILNPVFNYKIAIIRPLFFKNLPDLFTFFFFLLISISIIKIFYKKSSNLMKKNIPLAPFFFFSIMITIAF